MSATADAEFFSEYLGGRTDENYGKPLCPWLEVPGRTYPVREVFLEDLPLQLLCHMVKKYSI
jgi:HrpA-like RNA helicase